MVFYSVLIPCLLLLIAALVVRLTVRSIRKLRRLTSNRARRIAAVSLLAICSVVAIALAATSTINAIAVYRYRALHPPPGTIYRVDGYDMRLDCTGQGEPTIILDAGLGNDGLIWGTIQPALAKLTRVCSYDRAGFGWSARRPGPHDADHIANQLHGLLQQGKIAGPIVLMAHSIAGLYIRDYATRYPQGVVGLVFVDSSTPLQFERGSAALQAEMHKSPTLNDLGTRAAFALGIIRLAGQCSQKIPGFSAAASQSVAENLCLPSTGAAIADESSSFHQSGLETIYTGPYGDLPVLIFSHDPNAPNPPGPNASLAKEHETLWNDMQEDLKKLSTRSRRIIAKRSGHYVQVERTDLVIGEVTHFLQQLRDGAVPDVGSTQTQ